MLVGLRVQVKLDGETDDDSVTVPVKPLTGETVIVDGALVPVLVVMLVGLALIEKSVTV